MRTLVVALLTLAMVASAVPVAFVAFQGGPDDTVPAESTTPSSEDRLGANAPGTGSAGADGASSTPGTGTDPGSGSAGTSSQALQATSGSPLLQPSRPGASPMEMVEDLLGPAPDTLPTVSDQLSLAEAVAGHPAFPDETSPELPDGVEPWTRALARIVQAHGILAQTMTQASEGDEQAQELIPYATAQLAEEAERNGPIFDAASDLLALEAETRLDLYAEGGDLPEAGSLSQEVDRFYRLIGLPNLPVATPAQNEQGLAQLVRATASVVDATRQAEAATHTLGASEARIQAVHEALSDGQLTQDEAELLTRTATLVHQATVEPLQARLDALNTLFQVSREVVPTLTMPASHEPTHPPEDLPEPPEDLPEPPEELPEPPEEVPELPEGPGGLPSPSPGIGCVDPLCAITILDNNDTTVNGSEEPLPVAIPGVGSLESLFPQRPILVLDQGGNDTYEGLPRTEGFRDTINRTGEQEVTPGDLPVDGEQVIEDTVPEAGPTGPFVGFLKDLATDTYSEAVEGTLGITDLEARLDAETPVQVVIDLAGDDTYTGEEAAAYAAGGGLAAIIDAEGDDRYEVERGIGLLQESGLALVHDLEGDDTYIAAFGIGSVIGDEEGFSLAATGLGGFLDQAGNDTYEVGEFGIGVARYAASGGTVIGGQGGDLLAGSRPVALDLGGVEDEGFGPHLGDFTPEPGIAVEAQDDERGHVRVWNDHVLPPSDDPFSSSMGSGGHVLLTFAAHRTYNMDIGAISNGTVSVADHNVTVGSPSTCTFFGACFSIGLAQLDGQVRTGIHLQLTAQDDIYEPPYPLILVDAGTSQDRYVDASPVRRVDNATTGGIQIPTGEIVRELTGSDDLNAPSVSASTPVLSPMLVLDTGGDDDYTGDTAHLDTHTLTLIQNLVSSTPPIASAVIVDSQGDDSYLEGNVSSSFLNASADRFDLRPAWQLSTLLFDGDGEDTIEGELVAGTLMRNSRITGSYQQLGSSTSNLLLLGTRDTTLESRNTITAGPGSMAGIRLDTNWTDGVPEDDGVAKTTRATVGAAVAGPTDYMLGHHSLASIEWCKTLDAETCPYARAGPGAENLGIQTAVFLGSPGRDTYQVATNEGLGNVTLDDELGCSTTNAAGLAQVGVPRMVTRFVDVGGADSYFSQALRRDLPEWRNDAAWTGYKCQRSELLGTAADALGASTEDGSGLDRNPLIVVDALAIDNLAQYALSLAGGTTGTAVDALEDAGLQLEAPRLCVSPAFGTDAGTLVGFDESADGGARCASNTTDPVDGRQDNSDALADDPVTTTSRMVLMTESTRTIPVNAYDAVNPCDATENDGNRLLSLVAREENNVPGNPLATGVSGCWATLQIKPTNQPQGPSPVWHDLGPNAGPEASATDPDQVEETGWLDILAAPLSCGLVDEGPETDELLGDPGSESGELPLLCSTDAFPFPYHVDGTEGFNNGRWLLPDGNFQYRVQFHGPIGMLLNDDGDLGGEISLQHDPAKHLDVSCSSDPPNVNGTSTDQVRGILAWISCEGEDLVDANDEDEELPPATWRTVPDGLWLHGVSQRSGGSPAEAVVWSPANLTAQDDILLLLCHEGTPYKGQASTATAEWRQDLGLWATTYELDTWEDDGDHRQPTECVNFDPPSTSLKDGTNVTLGLYHGEANSTRPPRIIEIPSSRIDQSMAVDKADPFVDVGPLTLPTGQDLETHGMGVTDVRNAEVLDKLADLSGGSELGQPIHLELPVRVTDNAPVHEISFAGVTDHPWEANLIDPMTFRFKDASGTETTLACDNDLTEGFCLVHLNLTGAGPVPGANGLWERQATMNLTLDLDGATGDVAELRDALKRSITSNQAIDLELPGGIEVADEAGNVFSETSNLEPVIDLQRPIDVPLPCDGRGISKITSGNHTRLMTWATTEDIQGFMVQRKVQDDWATLQWVDLDDTVQSDRSCTPDNQGDWRTFLYEPAGAHFPEEGTEALHELRTVPIDHAGNRELLRGAFEMIIVFDRQAPDITVHQESSEPTELTVEVNATEPVRLESAQLVSGDGETQPPLRLPTTQGTSFTLLFDDLTPNTDYTVVAEVVDKAGHLATNQTTAGTAATINVSLARTPEVVGDSVTLSWTAGALGPLEGGSPSLRVLAQAVDDGVCSERRLDAFITADLDEPENRTVELPLTRCDGGELTFQLSIENGPVDEPLEQLVLEAKSLHDTEAPVPDLDFTGKWSKSGWLITPVTLHPTGTDDTEIAEAKIVTAGGPVDRLQISESGVHQVTVEATDAAGRTAEKTFRVLVDLHSPEVTLVSQDPLPTDKQLLTVLVRASDDASGLQSLRTQLPNGTWTPWSPVVEDMQVRVDITGLDVLVAEVRDRAGHVARATLPVTSLAEAPGVLDASVQAAGPGTIEIMTTLDRPMALEAKALIEGRTQVVATSQEATEHRITLHPVTPGQSVQVLVDALLTDGSKAPVEALSTRLEMPGDGGPPTAPTGLTADVLDDGSVELSWGAARDDAGIQQYLIRRTTQGAITGQWAQEETRLIDDPPAGATHTYRVQAVDLGDRTGAWSEELAVTPETPLRLLSYDISPEVATAGEPVQVTLALQASQAPEDVSVSLGDREVPLLLEERVEDRFIYRTNLTLPSTDTFFPEGLRFHVDDQVFPEQGTLPAPLVKRVADITTEETDDTPAPALIAVLLSVLSAAVARRRWSP